VKFSVLLPTRNGGLYLESCIRSILEQNYSDLELIISDNANTDQTAEIISRFSGDPRVKALRLDAPVSVTENWNNALRAASGDYVLVMGDDDYLLPHYFAGMAQLLDRYSQPDCVVYNAYSYIAPHSISGNVQSLYRESHFGFGSDLLREGRLDAEQRFDIVRDMFRFRVRIPLNMQTALISRRALMMIPGGAFQAPFPDHYALNSLLLSAEHWVFSPERLLVVGVSPKSFGHYVYSNQQGTGLAYLGIDANFAGRLPGNELINGMHIWLSLLKQNFPEDLRRVAIDRAGYVRRQVYAWYMQMRLRNITAAQFKRNLGLLSFSDWVALASSAWDKASWTRLVHLLGVDHKDSAAAQWQGLRRLDGIADIRQFALWLASRKEAP
jgi:glycosyltransferase involved in cell wall biosynthesis